MAASSQRGQVLAVRLVIIGFIVAGLASIGLAAIFIPSGLLGPSPVPEMLPPEQALLTLLLVLIALLGGIAFTVGLALYVFLPTRSYPDAVKTYARYPTILGALALAYIAFMVLVQPLILIVEPGMLGPERTLSPRGLVIGTVGIELALLLTAYFRIVRPGVISWSDMGLTLDDLPRRIGLGIITGIAILVAAGLLEQVLSYFGIEQNQAELFEGIKAATTTQFVAFLLAAAVLTGFAEEIFFRGYVFTALLRERSAWQAYIFSGVLFGIVHLNVAALLPLIVIGIILAYVYHQTRSLVPAIVAHGMNNLIALSVLYFGPGIGAG